MNNPAIFIQDWLKKHNERDKQYLFFIGFLVIYLLFFILFQHAVYTKKNEMEQQITGLNTKQTTMQQQFVSIQGAIKNPALSSLIAEQKKLAQQVGQMQQQIAKLRPMTFSPKELPRLTENVLVQHNHTILISLQEMPDEPWPPQSPQDKNLPEKADLLTEASGIYQHVLQLEFENDYANTIAYLKNLEKISNYVYWDSLEYKVLTYPKANIVVKFHVLSS